MIKNITNTTPVFFRPPYGAYHQGLSSMMAKYNKSVAMRSVDPKDRRDRNPRTVTQRVAQAKPGDIILLHDIHSTTIDAMSTAIQKLKNKGYTFVTMSKLIGTPIPGKIYRSQYR